MSKFHANYCIYFYLCNHARGEFQQTTNPYPPLISEGMLEDCVNVVEALLPDRRMRVGNGQTQINIKSLTCGCLAVIKRRDCAMIEPRAIQYARIFLNKTP